MRKEVKISLTISILLSLLSLDLTGVITAQTANPLEEKLIALDAGHGGTSLGATYPPNSGESGLVYEKDVNLAVVHVLKSRLEQAGAKVVLSRMCDETISFNKERVDSAVEKCKQIDSNNDGQPDGKKCDVLVSVHHNGNADTNYNGTLVIYNEKQDVPLAKALLEALAPLSGVNEGLERGGYGMTVYDHLVSALTEAYYITNSDEAYNYLTGTSTVFCQNNGQDYPVFIGERVNQEAQALYDGLVNYFNNLPSKPGRGK